MIILPGELAVVDGYTTTDGDTIRAFLSVDEVGPEEAIPGGWLMAEGRRYRTDRAKHPRGIAIRLVTLNTPETDEPGWAEAKADLAKWLDRWKRLRVETWPDGGFSRLLGDVYVDGRRDLTASAHMLSIGWPPYLTKAQQKAPRVLS